MNIKNNEREQRKHGKKTKKEIHFATTREINVMKKYYNMKSIKDYRETLHLLTVLTFKTNKQIFAFLYVHTDIEIFELNKKTKLNKEPLILPEIIKKCYYKDSPFSKKNSYKNGTYLMFD